MTKLKFLGENMFWKMLLTRAASATDWKICEVHRRPQGDNCGKMCDKF